MKKSDLKFTNKVIYFLIGFTTIIAQVIFIREFMVAFYGNELTLGVVLAIWLAWIALGSISYGKIFKKIKKHYNLISIFLFLISLLLPVTVYSIRIARSIFIIVPGELPGLLPSLLSATVILAPVCLLSGAFFALASQSHSKNTAHSTSTVYKFEAIGSAIGGLLLSFVLLGNLNSFQIVLFLSFVNTVLAFTIKWQELSKIVKMVLVVLCVLFVTFSGYFGTRLHLITTLSLWKNTKFIESKDSVYGHLTVVDNEGEKSIYSNGIKIMTSGDIGSVEELVHYALLQHPDPEKILFIGSAHPDIFNEIFEYESVRKIDYVELDPAITELSKKYFASSWGKNLNNKNINLINQDGRFFIKETKNQYDVIIVNSGDPLNANINRFYTVEFFEEIKSRLAASGIFTFQLSSSENYLNKELTNLLKIINKSLRDVFAEVKIIPGENIHFFAANDKYALNLNTNFLIERLEKRKINNVYVNEYYLHYILLQDRIQEVEKIIRPDNSTLINNDFKPIAYFFNLIFWSSQFSPTYSSISQFINNVSFEMILLVIITLMLLLFIITGIKRNKQNTTHKITMAAVFIMGATLITLEIIILLGFQAKYGYLYQQMAALIGFFMAGIAVGSGFFLKQKSVKIKLYLNQLIIVHILLSFLPILFLAMFEVDMGMFNQPMIFLSTFFCGVAGGYQFPLATRIYFSDIHKSNQNIGILYGFDITGAMLGTLVFGILCIPLFGFWKVSLIIFIINLLISIFTFLNTKYEKLNLN